MQTYDALCKRLVLEGGQAQVPYLDRPRGAGDEDVVAFQVPMDDRGSPAVEEVETLEDLPAPVLEDFHVYLFEPLYVPASSVVMF